MKKKRIILHISILILAVICMVAEMYVCYYEKNVDGGDWTFDYNIAYSSNVEEIITYAYTQEEFRRKFGDDNKVLIENKELGNITVRDIKEIFAERYRDYYTNNTDIDFSDQSDYEEYLEYSDDEEFTPESEYDLNVLSAQKFRADWKKNPTEENRIKYKYYEDQCKYVDEYAKLTEILLKDVEDSNETAKKYNDFEYVAGIQSVLVGMGMKYRVQYQVNGETYTIANVSGKNEFEGNYIVDLATVKNGKLVLEKPSFDKRQIDDGNIIESLKVITDMQVAIDTRTEGGYYADCLEHIKNQISEKQKEQMKKSAQLCMVIIVAASVIAFVLYIVLMLMAGHKEKGDEAQLYRTDKLWWEAELAVAAVIYAILITVLAQTFFDEGYYKLFGVSLIVITLPAIEFVLLISESIMRRLKTKSFLKTSLLGKIWNLIKVFAGKIKIGTQRMFANLPLTLKVFALGTAAAVWNLIQQPLIGSFDRFAEILIMICIPIGIICYIVWRYFSERQKIQKGTEIIAGGRVDYKIVDEMKFQSNRKLKEEINNIGAGLNAAVEESVKNERMKTELITNVSHDLKTPLTSIINYVDLLKTDGVDSENAQKYLEILEQKSQRLKNLTEDLVEVSKLSSGVAKMERQKIDIVQLVNQSLGEYDEKFSGKQLQIVKTIQEEPIYVMADGRKTWRLFDNLYSNIFKYAMTGTRVYVDIRTTSGKVVVSLKNISETPLNFSTDELMERFVRGDVSRTTEGSGLGLSIAKSIAERQDGELEITLDGDLFKVEVMMNLI